MVEEGEAIDLGGGKSSPCKRLALAWGLENFSIEDSNFFCCFTL